MKDCFPYTPFIGKGKGWGIGQASNGGGKRGMANLQLNRGETLIGSGMVVYWEPYGLFNYSTWSGYIYVTNHRVLFHPLISSLFTLELPLAGLNRFWTSKHFFVPAVTICDKNAETFRFSGFKTKKLVSWLQQLGIPKV